MRSAAIIGLAVGVAVMLLFLVLTIFNPSEAVQRLAFVAGGVIGGLTLIVVDLTAMDSIRGWAETAGSVFGAH
jgi:hypothetical protein